MRAYYNLAWSLDLSNNDIQEINKTDLALYSNLEVLDLSRNKINTFQGS